MKIAIEPHYIHSEYLDHYSDEELRGYGIYDKEKALEPVKIENLYLVINSAGNLVMGFESPNYKYLKFQFGKTINQAIDGEFSGYWTHYLTIESTIQLPWIDSETGRKSTGFNVPLVEFEIALEPENDWERDLLHGDIVTLSRWSHEICFVPWTQIEPGRDDDDLIENPETDTIYTYDLKKLSKT